ncbi:MAG: peptidase U32 family protein, partial [Acutalibacteraceae bacterium]
MNNKIEVLSPCGDLSRLITAVDYGADAVYFAGKEFGMRAAPANLSVDEIAEGVAYAHARGVRCYLTLNTLPRNDEIAELPKFIRSVAERGIDAFIVTDVGSIPLVKKYAPNAELHISVQTGILNYNTANFYYELGARRVVLARELSLREIAEIRQTRRPILSWRRSFTARSV